MWTLKPMMETMLCTIVQHNETIAKILLECGRLKIDEMNDIEHFTKNEDGSMEFQYDAFPGGKFQIKMNSSTSVKSIEKI